MSAPSRWRFDAIGTTWEIETPAPLDARARDAVDVLIARFDRDWSRFRDDSVVAALARDGGAVPAPADTTELLDLYVALTDATAGAVQPLIGASLERLGYDAAYSLRPAGAPEPAPADWRSRITWDDRELRVAEPSLIDVGAIGKGRLVDLVADLIDDRCPGDVLVDAGGDLRVRGTPVRVGLEHPYDPTRAIGVAEVRDGALCASATTRRAWGDGLHHVLDARTGEPVRTVVATWATAASAMVADAAATALFFDGGPAFAHDHRAGWVRMLSDGRVEYSPDSPAELFTS